MMRYYQTTQPDLVKLYTDYLADRNAVFDDCGVVAKSIGADEPVFIGHVLHGYKMSGFRFDAKPDADLWIENKRFDYWRLRAKAKAAQKSASHKLIADQINGIKCKQYCVVPTLKSLGIANIYTTAADIRISKDAMTVFMALSDVPAVNGWDEITASQFEASGVPL